MKFNEPRMVVASIGVFIWLAGLYFTIHGLIYDVSREFHYGMWALGIGIVIFVVALNPLAQRRPDKRDRST
ncbi:MULTISPECIES: DUF2964 family protein [Caballeronia]|uniref:DUF2964 domain-containing protein n=1 Tax=Caballeronia cordobensis TaxID=1353886 RepID=A0A158FYI5_CABCO|nr:MULTISPECIES: DUF2964 family protein [Caballeronia]AQH04050.1 hypothetical protein A9R05_34385 [Burkholderia sp. KK1]BAO91603.1 uncharacterized protein BRPE67_DCDS04480 [Burkholderia sp. RPE67]BBQ00957.1 hypothetical protein BSFA1_60850 [Burkholderia sp. SFA1]MCE4545606.1 DUF2964 domain-containing protein [Caballeronia sp. PC1]MCE4572270.1 DUF2964 domain-containing protein [Caballeronia sp. CLC5]